MMACYIVNLAMAPVRVATIKRSLSNNIYFLFAIIDIYYKTIYNKNVKGTTDRRCPEILVIFYITAILG